MFNQQVGFAKRRIPCAMAGQRKATCGKAPPCLPPPRNPSCPLHPSRLPAPPAPPLPPPAVRSAARWAPASAARRPAPPAPRPRPRPPLPPPPPPPAAAAPPVTRAPAASPLRQGEEERHRRTGEPLIACGPGMPRHAPASSRSPCLPGRALTPGATGRHGGHAQPHSAPGGHSTAGWQQRRPAAARTRGRQLRGLGLREADCVQRFKLEGPLLRPLAVCSSARQGAAGRRRAGGRWGAAADGRRGMHGRGAWAAQQQAAGSHALHGGSTAPAPHLCLCTG